MVEVRLLHRALTRPHWALLRSRGIVAVLLLQPHENWRGLTTRYDKHALTYRGGVVLASILLWLE